jgi:predicted RND superfamily exporter protein
MSGQDATGPPTGAEASKRLNIALGVERFGLIPLRAPALSIILVVVLAVAAVLGIQRIRIDDSLSQLFRSDTPEFKQFEQVSHQFPSSEYDVLLVIEGKSLLARDSIEKLRSLVTDLQLVDGARGIISLFSARQPSETNGVPAPLFPEQLPEGPEYDKLVQRATGNELIRGKLLSDDGTLALVVLSLDPAVVESAKLKTVIGDIRQTMSEDMQGADLSSQLSGVPVMQLEIRNALERDRLVYNAIGFLVGCAIAITFFRRLSLMIVAAGPPLLAILFALGAFGWLGFRLNMFLNVMTPLIMVISFSDSMQLTFAARDRIMAGEDKRAAFSHAIRVVGPACVLTHATAGLSFLGLLFSDSQVIRAFGEAGFIATLVALVTVLSLVPVFGVLLVRKETASVSRGKGADAGVEALRRFCGWVAGRMVRRPGAYSLVGLLVVCGLAAVYLELQPRYRLADQVPDKEQAVQASGRLDDKLTGSNPIDVLIEFPQDADLYSPQTLDTIADVHRVLEEQTGIGNVWSLETLRRWLAQKMSKSDVGTLKQYVDLLPQYLVRRFVSVDQKAVVVSGLVPDKDAGMLLPIVNQVNAKLDAVRAQRPGYTIAVTGLSVIAARNSAGMIGKLNRGLTIEFVFIAAFIGLAFRSLPVMLASLLPGVFPVVAAGTLLWLLGEGLQFSSIVALTVSFGLGLSATIHFLNRMWREDRTNKDPAIAVERATVLVGPALILTSVVLACGLAALAFSNLPSLRLFGWLSAFAMLAALAADLLILRPTITYLMRLGRQIRPYGLPRRDSEAPYSSQPEASYSNQPIEGRNNVNN